MAYQQKEMSGTLFRNDKGGVESRPDVRGECLINGVLYTIAGWRKEGPKGPFSSLSFQPKQDRQEAPRQSGTEVAKNAYSRARDDLDAPPF